jgi:hypothetical protein
MDRDAGNRGHSVGIVAEQFGRVSVEGAGPAAAQLLVAHEPHHGHDRGWKQHAVIQTHVGEPLVEQLGEHRGGPIQGVLGRKRPPGRLRHFGFLALLHQRLAARQYPFVVFLDPEAKVTRVMRS